jgi:hypothetical protein
MSLEGFSADQVAHIAATTLDFYVRGKLHEIGIQDKPLLAAFESAMKPYTGAKENISLPVRFDRGAGGVNDGVQGFSGAEQVHFYSPGGAKRANYVWREHHIGWKMTETELKTQGILVSDEFGKQRRGPNDRGLVILTNIFEAAMADFGDRYAVTMNALLWGDGTTDAAALHGIRAFIQDIPTVGAVGGLSGGVNEKWRNRSRTAAFFGAGTFDADWGGNKVTSAPTNGGVLLQILQKDLRQLRRYGGNPNRFHAGSDFIDAMEVEMRANGQYSQTGFTKKQDGSMGEMMFKGMEVVYDPTLDDLGRAKFAYIWDDRRLYLQNLEGDWKRTRNPARPYDQFVFHESMICTGQVVCDQRDCSEVIEIN